MVQIEEHKQRKCFFENFVLKNNKDYFFSKLKNFKDRENVGREKMRSLISVMGVHYKTHFNQMSRALTALEIPESTAPGTSVYALVTPFEVTKHVLGSFTSAFLSAFFPTLNQKWENFQQRVQENKMKKIEQQYKKMVENIYREQQEKFSVLLHRRAELFRKNITKTFASEFQRMDEAMDKKVISQVAMLSSSPMLRTVSISETTTRSDPSSKQYVAKNLRRKFRGFFNPIILELL